MKKNQILFLSLLVFSGIATAAESSVDEQAEEKSLVKGLSLLRKLPKEGLYDQLIRKFSDPDFDEDNYFGLLSASIDLLPENERTPFFNHILHVYNANKKLHRLNRYVKLMVLSLPENEQAPAIKKALDTYLDQKALQLLSGDINFIISKYKPDNEWKFFADKIIQVYSANKMLPELQNILIAIIFRLPKEEQEPFAEKILDMYLEKNILNTFFDHTIPYNIRTHSYSNIFSVFLSREKKRSFAEKALTHYLTNNKLYELKITISPLIRWLPIDKKKFFINKIIHTYFDKNTFHELANLADIINESLSNDEKIAFRSQPRYKTQECMWKIYQYVQRETPEKITAELLKLLAPADIICLTKSILKEPNMKEEYTLTLWEKYLTMHKSLSFDASIEPSVYLDLFSSLMKEIVSTENELGQIFRANPSALSPQDIDILKAYRPLRGDDKPRRSMWILYNYLHKEMPKELWGESVKNLNLTSHDICSLVESAQKVGLTTEQYKSLCEQYLMMQKELPADLSIEQCADLFLPFLNESISNKEGIQQTFIHDTPLHIRHLYETYNGTTPYAKKPKLEIFKEMLPGAESSTASKPSVDDLSAFK